MPIWGAVTQVVNSRKTEAENKNASPRHEGSPALLFEDTEVYVLVFVSEAVLEVFL